MACSELVGLPGGGINTEEMMNSGNTEVEETEILEAEVVENRQPVRSGKLAGLVLLVALLVAAGSAFYSYQSTELVSADLTDLKNTLEAVRNQTGDLSQQLNAAHSSYQTQSQQLVEQKRALAEQQQALAAHKQLLLDKDAKLEQERSRLEQTGQEIREAIQSVHQRIGGDNSHWMAAEAAYLIQIANHRLHLEWDVQTAINALETADARLRDSSDPNWIPVREILAQEITDLKGVKPADIEGLALQLTSLAGGAKDLKLLGTELDPAARPAPVSTRQPATTERTLKTLLHDGWEGFKSIMVIRHHGQPMSALLPADQQLFMQQNLRLQLEAARISLLRRNQALFDSSLHAAVQLLEEYFDSDDAKVKSYLEQVGAISKFNLRPQIPDISASLIALREQFKKVGDN